MCWRCSRPIVDEPGTGARRRRRRGTSRRWYAATRHCAPFAIIYVYPWTGRPGLADPQGWDEIAGAHGSTPETAGFRDRYARFLELGVEVFGLSTQDTEHQLELSVRLGLPFPLLSDAAFRMQKALRLPTFEAGGAPYLRRLTLYVCDGRIGHLFYPVHPPEAHAVEVLDWLEPTRRRGGA